MNDGSNWFAEVDASTTVRDVATALGLTVKRRKFGPPPCCGDNDPRGAAGSVRDKLWVCKCGAKGNMTALVRAANPGMSWPEVRAWFASHGWCSSDGTRSSWTPPPARPPEPPPAYPELGSFLTLGGPVEDDREVAAFWTGRGFGARTGAAWALPERADWPAWWGCGYKRAWRLACPMYDAAGVVRSVHARAVVDVGEMGKTRSPKGCRLDSLLFADPWIAVPMLRGERVACDVLVAEGITDYCALTSVSLPGVAVLGGISGSFKALADVRLPAGCVVFVGTDNDTAGDKYAAEVVAAVGDRAECRRVVWGIRGQDASDIVKAGVDVRVRLARADTIGRVRTFADGGRVG